MVGMTLPDFGGLFHHERCLGCGDANPHAMALHLHAEGERVVGHVRFDEHREGAPGYVHGGAVALVLDDALGTVPIILKRPSVTANLNVDFRAPILLGATVTIAAWLVSNRGSQAPRRRRAARGRHPRRRGHRTVRRHARRPLVTASLRVESGVTIAKSGSGRSSRPSSAASFVASPSIVSSPEAIRSGRRRPADEDSVQRIAPDGDRGVGVLVAPAGQAAQNAVLERRQIGLVVDEPVERDPLIPRSWPVDADRQRVEQLLERERRR